MDFMVYLAVFSDILLSFLHDGCLTRKEFSTKQCSIAVISLFVIIGVTYLIIGCTIPFLCIRKCNCKLKIQEFAALIVYIIQLKGWEPEWSNPQKVHFHIPLWEYSINVFQKLLMIYVFGHFIPFPLRYIQFLFDFWPFEAISHNQYVG